MGAFDKLDAIMASRTTDALAKYVSEIPEVPSTEHEVMLAEPFTGSYVRLDGTTTCCNSYSSIGDFGEFCKGCYETIEGTIGDDGHPL